jgi:pyridinium-3,5-biscarboxylic acid mononucleotide sulfurtransferase
MESMESRKAKESILSTPSNHSILVKFMNNVLHALLRSYGRVAVGFSGGVDSSFLLWSALQALGPDKVLAIIADTPTLPRFEFASALQCAEQLGARILVVTPNELDDPAYAANPPDRCYLCKRRIFGMIREMAAAQGFEIVLDGTNVDDAMDQRPGQRAAQELGVKSPLAEAGLTKADIRAFSAQAGLPTAQLPSNACLATRIPSGTPITRERLGCIERAEGALRDLGFLHCRVRHHGDVARLEFLAGDFDAVMTKRHAITQAIKAAGYRFVALDLEGYRMGSMNG